MPDRHNAKHANRQAVGPGSNLSKLFRHVTGSPWQAHQQVQMIMTCNGLLQVQTQIEYIYRHCGPIQHAPPADAHMNCCHIII